MSPLSPRRVQINVLDGGGCHSNLDHSSEVEADDDERGGAPASGSVKSGSGRSGKFRSAAVMSALGSRAGGSGGGTSGLVQQWFRERGASGERGGGGSGGGGSAGGSSASLGRSASSKERAAGAAAASAAPQSSRPNQGRPNQANAGKRRAGFSPWGADTSIHKSASCAGVGGGAAGLTTARFGPEEAAPSTDAPERSHSYFSRPTAVMASLASRAQGKPRAGLPSAALSQAMGRGAEMVPTVTLERSDSAKARSAQAATQAATGPAALGKEKSFYSTQI